MTELPLLFAQYAKSSFSIVLAWIHLIKFGYLINKFNEIERRFIHGNFKMSFSEAGSAKVD